MSCMSEEPAPLVQNRLGVMKCHGEVGAQTGDLL
jgi:hypothetical protein